MKFCTMRNYIWKTIWLVKEKVAVNKRHFRYNINKLRKGKNMIVTKNTEALINMTYRVGPSIAEVAVGLAGLIVGLVVVMGRGKGETALLLWVVVMVMVRCAVEREVLLTAVGKGWTCCWERGVTPVSTCRSN
jgi:hypothetical protein